MTFISQALDGKIYIAEPSRKGSQKLLWSVMPENGDPSNPEASGGKRTEPHKVPLRFDGKPTDDSTTSGARRAVR